MKGKKGFTLLELLVVVLIIGVLTLIVVPQYRLAVARTRISEMVMLASRLHEEEKAYFLINGQYASDLSKLDIDWESCSASYCYYGKLRAGIGSDNYAAGYWLIVGLRNMAGANFPSIETYNAKRFECLTHGYESNAEICKLFGGRTRPNSTTYYYMDNL